MKTYRCEICGKKISSDLHISASCCGVEMVALESSLTQENSENKEDNSGKVELPKKRAKRKITQV